MRISDWSSDVCSSDLRTESVYPLLRPALFCLVPERAHRQTMRLLELAYHTGMYRMLWPAPKPLPTRAFGLEFRNPVGLAAGLAKNCATIDPLFGLGFGFVDNCTVNHRPQTGYLRPRAVDLGRAGELAPPLGLHNTEYDP